MECVYFLLQQEMTLLEFVVNCDPLCKDLMVQWLRERAALPTHTGFHKGDQKTSAMHTQDQYRLINTAQGALLFCFTKSVHSFSIRVASFFFVVGVSHIRHACNYRAKAAEEKM